MSRLLFCFTFIYFVHYVVGYQQPYQLCENNTQKMRSCTQILDHDHSTYDSCKVEYFPSNSTACKSMNFRPIEPNTHIGDVTLQPYILPITRRLNTSIYSVNYTVLNITFSNIKWKTMKFRFQPSSKTAENHCRNIVISNNLTINDQSVLYYDCYWSLTNGNYNGQSHILDFEAMDENDNVNRGQYYFNIPSAQMLNPLVSEENWKPFIYIEILPTTMKLHVMPPPKPLKINGYKIQVMKECIGIQCDELVKTVVKTLKNFTEEVTFEDTILRESGSYYFVVTPLHDKCNGEGNCNHVVSPKIKISSEVQTLNICIASVTALIVATLFAYYIVLRVIRRYWCKDYSLASGNEIPAPPKVLVIYSPANRLHAECVASLVTYLRSEYGIDVMYDGDISATAHEDPYRWANEAFEMASHVLYIVGPAEQSNLYSSIYEKPIISVHKDVDLLLLSLLRASRARCTKDISNIFFEHSNGQIPLETKHDKVFFLLKDWQKLIAHLSKNLLPKKLIMRTEKGKSFLDDLTRAKKLLTSTKEDVVIKCEKNLFEKKILL